MNSLNQVNLVLLLFSLFTIKHFIVDYWLQNEYQWSNKGKYFHPGGVLHSALHGFVTFIIFSFVYFENNKFIYFAIVFSVVEFFIHYHIDWIKSNISETLRYKQEHKGFWILLGIDQTLHFLTYVLLIYLYSIISYNVLLNSIIIIGLFTISSLFLCCCIMASLIHFYTNFLIKQLDYDS
jgi:hypothetical protein